MDISGAKIRQIVNTLKTISFSPEVSLRLVKSSRTYEGLLWGKADNIPLGAYSRGASINQVFDKLSSIRIGSFEFCFEIFKLMNSWRSIKDR